MIGVYINDSLIPFTSYILLQMKNVETRRINTLGRWAGEVVAIIRSEKGRKPVVVGYMIYDKPFRYSGKKEFEEDYTSHYVSSDSPFFFKDKKIGYRILTAWPCKPYPLPAYAKRLGRVAAEW